MRASKLTRRAAAAVKAELATAAVSETSFSTLRPNTFVDSGSRREISSLWV